MHISTHFSTITRGICRKKLLIIQCKLSDIYSDIQGAQFTDREKALGIDRKIGSRIIKHHWYILKFWQYTPEKTSVLICERPETNLNLNKE